MEHQLLLPNNFGIYCISMPEVRNLCDQIVSSLNNHSYSSRNFFQILSNMVRQIQFTVDKYSKKFSSPNFPNQFIINHYV